MLTPVRTLMVRGAGGIVASLALAAPASAATLDAGSLLIVTGQSSLLAPFPEPVGHVFGTTPSAVSQDGRFVAFSATSDGLSAADDDTVANVYVKDRLTGAVTFASRRDGPAGEPSHSSCFDASISDDGTRVAFTCSGSLDPADTNTQTDVYVRDLPTSRTILVSRATGLGVVGNDRSEQGVLSQTGRYVAFESQASNLVPGAIGGNVYRREIDGANATIVASRKTGGAPGGGVDPSISDDGNRIAFAYDHNTFYDPADTNNSSDVFVHDENADTTVLASREDGPTGTVGNGASMRPAIAGNGSYVAFESTANQFDFDNDSDTQPDIYRRALAAGATQLVNIAADGTKGGPAEKPTIDDSGDVVGWVSRTTALDPADADVADPDVYYKDGNEVHLASRADGTDGAPAGNADSGAVSGDGTKFVMQLRSPITTDGEPRRTSLILRDVTPSPQRTFSVARPGGTEPFRNDGGYSYDLHLSADGRFAVFLTEAAALGVPDDARNAVVVRDLVTDAVTVASRADGATGAIFTGGVDYPAISADGRRVAFSLYTGTDTLVYVRDLAAGRTFLASRADGEGVTAGGDSSDPVLDGDGSRVAFTSTAANLGDGDTDASSDVHLRDLDTNRTLLVSRATGAGGAKGDGESRHPAISADGTRVAFISKATNLGDGDADTVADLHLRDLAADTTTLVSAAPGGPKSDGNTGDADIDASGTRLAFSAQSTNLLGLTTLRPRVFVRDLAAGTLTLASRADGADGAPADESSSEAQISPDGGFVAFGTSSTNLAPGVEPDSYEVYRRDLVGNRTVLVSRGNPSSQTDYPRTVTNGGACVAFDALAALVGPPVDGEQGYVRVFERNCGRPSPPAGPGGGDSPAARDLVAPVLSKARLSRRRLRIGRKPTARVAKVGRGTVLRFTSSEAAKLTLRFERPRPGRRTTAKGRRVCKPVKHRPKRRACTAYRRDGTLTRQIRSGPGRVALSGRIGRRALRRGRHRLTLVATDAAGNRSRAVRLSFRIVA
jgi:Tol biopolymer transport system component